MKQTVSFSVTIPQSGAAPIGTAGITGSLSSLVVPLGQSVTLTYTITGAVSAFLGGDMMPGGNIPLIADGQQHNLPYTPKVSGPLPLQAVDAAGGVVVQPETVVVQQPNLPALDPTAAPTRTTVKSGALDDPATWGGALPGRDDICLIAAGHALTYAGKGFWTGRLLIAGSLTVAGGVPIVSDLHVQVGGSLTLDGTTAAGKALVLLMNRPRHANDTADFWRAVFIEGTLTERGAPLTPIVRLAAEPQAGDKLLRCATPVSGWTIGSKLLLGDSRQLPSTEWGTSYVHQNEIAIVRGVSADGLTVYLLSPLQFEHPAGYDYQGNATVFPHVVNLTRTAGLVTSDPTDMTSRAHFQATGRALLDCQYAVFHGLGRTTQDIATGNTEGRHNCYLTGLIGPVTPPSFGAQWRLDGCVLLDPYPVVPQSQSRWGLRIDNSHYGLVNDCVMFNWCGAGIMLTGGNETGNLLQGNFVCKVFGTGNPRDNLGTDGSGIVSYGFNNRFRGNTVVNAFNPTGGIVPGSAYNHFTFPAETASKHIPTGPGKDPATDYTLANAQHLPMLEWTGNEAYGAMSTGLTLWYLYAPTPNTFTSPLFWNLWSFNVFFYPVSQVTFVAPQFYNDPDNPLTTCFAASDYNIDKLLVQGGTFHNQVCVVDYMVAQKAMYFDSCVSCVSGPHFNIEGRACGGTHAGNFPCRNDVVNHKFIAHPKMTTPALQTIVMSFDLGAGTRNYVVLDQTFVTSYQQVQGDNFQVFYHEQTPDTIVPVSTTYGPGWPDNVGCPVAGLNNTQALAQYGVCNAGAIVPADAVDGAPKGVVGLIK